jgi:hypothetical protein
LLGCAPTYKADDPLLGAALEAGAQGRITIARVDKNLHDLDVLSLARASKAAEVLVG